jgi:type VI secretion system protein ImpJ
VPPLFPRYDHQNPRGSFLVVMDFIERALTQGISELYTRVPFRQEGNAFVAYFDPDWMGRELVLEVRGRSGSTPRPERVSKNSRDTIGHDTRRESCMR